MNSVKLTLIAIAAIAVLVVTDQIISAASHIDGPVTLSINQFGDAELQYGSMSSPTLFADNLR